jgi:hypothetical protein
MKLNQILNGFALAALFTAAAFAQNATSTTQTSTGTTATAPAHKRGEVQRRELNQRRRIHQGVKSGELTKGETKKLKTEEKDLHQEVKDQRELNGGKLTQTEKKADNQQENKLSRQIYRDKHNGRKRNPPPAPAATASK